MGRGGRKGTSGSSTADGTRQTQEAPLPSFEPGGDWRKETYQSDDGPYVSYIKSSPATWLDYHEKDGEGRWELKTHMSEEEGRELLKRGEWTKTSDRVMDNGYYVSKETYVREDGATLTFDIMASWSGPVTESEARRIAAGGPILEEPKYEKLTFRPDLSPTDLRIFALAMEKGGTCTCDGEDVCESCDRVNQIRAEADHRESDEKAGIKRVVSDPKKSPAHSEKGNLRNLSRMSSPKLSQLALEMQSPSPDGRLWKDVDRESYKKVREEVESRDDVTVKCL